MAFVDGSSLPVDQLDHVDSIHFNNHCSAQQWVDGWSQANNSSSSQRPARVAAAIQHAVRQYWTKGIETSIVIRLRAKVD